MKYCDLYKFWFYSLMYADECKCEKNCENCKYCVKKGEQNG
jgi:hypothetical protein